MFFTLVVFLVVLLLSGLGWFLFSMGFPEFRKKRWCFLWLGISTLGVLLYRSLLMTEVFSSENLRQILISIAMFWLVFQIALIVVSPLWLIQGLCRWRQVNGKMVWWIGFIILTIPLGIAVKGSFFPDPWRVVEIEIRSERIPYELDGMKIAQISDTHAIYSKDINRIREQVQTAADQKADLLVFTGDLADNVELVPEAVGVLKAAESQFPLGVWSILGNHEYFRGLDVFLEEYQRQESVLLRNELKTLSYQGFEFYLGGVVYPMSSMGGGGMYDLENGRKDLAQALEKRDLNKYMILATHHPKIFDEGFSKEIDLMLAGHTHGYQVGFFGKSANIFDPYSWGLYESDGKFGYVSAGAGEWFPVRWGVPQEVVIFTLRAE